MCSCTDWVAYADVLGRWMFMSVGVLALAWIAVTIFRVAFAGNPGGEPKNGDSRGGGVGRLMSFEELKSEVRRDRRKGAGR